MHTLLTPVCLCCYIASPHPGYKQQQVTGLLHATRPSRTNPKPQATLVSPVVHDRNAPSSSRTDACAELNSTPKSTPSQSRADVASSVTITATPQLRHCSVGPVRSWTHIYQRSLCPTRRFLFRTLRPLRCGNPSDKIEATSFQARTTRATRAARTSFLDTFLIPRTRPIN